LFVAGYIEKSVVGKLQRKLLKTTNLRPQQ
jgi:hypothetical protein